jgi:heme-degrading monooxygenase HmoA
MMAIYQSMQRVRFSSPDGYEKFKVVFADVRRHLMTLPGFLHLTWWTHPDDPTWHNEVSFWTSFEALKDWHLNVYHKNAKEWAVRTGAIMEDIITNFEFKNARLIRVCPCCSHISDQAYDLDKEQTVLMQPCPTCGYHFPTMSETKSSTAVFKDLM